MKKLILISIILFSAHGFAGGTQGGGVGKMTVSYDISRIWKNTQNDLLGGLQNGTYVYFFKFDSSSVSFVLVSSINNVVSYTEETVSIDELMKYSNLVNGLTISKKLNSFAKIY